MDKDIIEQFLRQANRNASGVLSVAPLRGKYVWVDEELPSPNRGTVTFEAKGHNDICICLHTDSSSNVVGRDGLQEGSPVYEILFGGWSNQKSAIRKHGIQKMVISKTDMQAAVIQDSHVFSSYWITIQDEWIYAGMGEMGCNEILRWRDPHSSARVRCVGFSSWNMPLQFKNIRITQAFIPRIHGFELNGYELLDTSVLSDASIRTKDGVELPVHRCLLDCWDRQATQSLEVNDTPLCEPLLSDTSTKDKSPSDEPPTDPQPDASSSPPTTGEMEIPEENLWNTLPAALMQKVLHFLYTGQLGALTHGEAVQLMSYASRYSLTPLLETLQEMTCNEMCETPKSAEQLIHTLVRFDSLWKSPLYADAVFLCTDQDDPRQQKQIVAHRAVLAMWSKPFLAMFSAGMRESQQREIFLPEVDIRDFKLFLSYCYTGTVTIPPQRAISLLMLADRFRVTPLQQRCDAVIIKYIDVDNCCPMLEMACLYNWTTLRAHCMRFIETNFKTVVEESSEFVEMSADCLLELFLSDDLMVSEEYEVYCAFRKWEEHRFPVGHDGEAGASVEGLSQDQLILEDLACCIRFPLISMEVIRQEVFSHPLYHQSKRFREHIERTVQYLESTENDLDTSHSQLDNFTLRPRTVFRHQQLLFSYCGDKNGVFYYLGSQRGKNTIWQNPHKLGLVTVKLSSPPSRYCRSELVVGRSFTTMNVISGSPPWCMIDLGEEHELVCNHYTIRSDNSGAFLQDWSLQAAHDPNESWVTLRVHKQEEPFQFADWPVFGRHARFPYRYFRLLGGEKVTSFGISSIEFYGYFK